MKTHFPRALFSICTILAVLMAATLLCPDVFAQTAGQYIQTPVDSKVLRESRSKVTMGILRRGFQSGDIAVFDEYYKKCVFPAWTDPKSYSAKGKIISRPRKDLHNNFRTAKSGPVYDRLNDVVFEQMQVFAKGNYHPACRYNAMLMLGELNVRQPEINTPPAPLPKALDVLLISAEDQNLPDAVRVAALLGIMRHAKYGATDDASRQKISNQMLALAAMRDAPQGRSKAGHGWFRRLAIDTLGQLGSPGTEGQIAKTLAAVISETDAPLSVRCEAARALSQLKLTPETGLDPKAVAKSLGQLAVDAIEQEDRVLAEDADRKINARKLKACFVSIRMALTGSERRTEEPFRGILALATQPEDKAFALGVRNQIEQWLDKDHLDRKDLTPQEESPKAAGQEPFGEGGGFMEPMGGGFGPAGAGTGTPDPTRVASDEVRAKLKDSVETFKKFLAAGK